MASLAQQSPIGTTTAPTTYEVTLDWDAAGNLIISNLPSPVKLGDSVHFSSPSGPVSIVFLSPTGNPAETVTDQDVIKLERGGFYHFQCSIAGELSTGEGGVIDIVPHK